MIILGVDTSLRSTGFGVVESVGSRLRALDYIHDLGVFWVPGMAQF